MSIQRLPNWQIPNIQAADDDPQSVKDIADWLRIHHIEHDEESANVALDFEKLVIDTIYPTNVESTTITATNLTVTTSITLSGTTANRLLSTDVSNVAVSTDLFSWVAGTSNQVNVANDNDGTITLGLPQDIHSSASPTFVTAKLSALTDGYVPYHVADATGLANSDIYYDGTDVSVFKDATSGENPLLSVYGYITAGTAVRYASLTMDDTNDEFLIQSENNANHEGITIDLTETNQKFRIRQNSDYLSINIDGDDPYVHWNDGELTFQTDEGTNTKTILSLKPKGTGSGGGDPEQGHSMIKLYDADGTNFSTFQQGDDFSALDGALGDVLHINPNYGADVWYFFNRNSDESGDNRTVRFHGYITAGAGKRYTDFIMSDANDEFLIQAEDSSRHEGITIDLTEASQKFRIRQNNNYLSIRHDGANVNFKTDDGTFTFQTDEGTDTTTVVRVRPKGDAAAAVEVFDPDGSNWASFWQQGGSTNFVSADGDPLRINYLNAQNVTFFGGMTTGNTPEVTIGGYRSSDSLRLLEIGVGIDAADTASFDGLSNYTFDGNIHVGGSNNELRFYEGANYVGFEAPALSANQIWVLPSADGNADDILQTSGGGVLSWVTVSGGTFAGLSDTDINDTVAYVDGQIVIYEATAGKWYNRTMSGDVTISDTGVTVVANDSHTHSIYSLADGTRAFTGVVGGIPPTSAAHLATKEYVDDSIGIVLDYHFNNTTANIDEETETTYNMESIEYAGEENITRTAITAASNQLLYCFATLVGEPGGIDLPHGGYDAHFHLEASTAGGARTVDVYWTLSSVDADGTNESEPPIMTSETEAGVTGGETEYTIHAHLDADVNVGSASRLLLKVYGNGNAGSDTIMQFHVEGDTGTHFTMKATSAIFNTIYVRQDGTTPLTANWDVGNYTLTANGLTIDGTFTDGTLSIVGGDISSAGTITATNLAGANTNWDNAYGWGDHSGAGYAVSGGAEHNGFSDFVAGEHKSLPNTIVEVLNDHDKVAHDSLGILHSSLGGLTTGNHHAKNHEALHRSGSGDELNHDDLAGFEGAEHLVLPAGIAAVLNDHNTAAHDALDIDADTVDGEEAAAIVTKARVDAVSASHDSLSDVTTGNHHAKSHSLASHSSEAHSELTDVGVDDHHAQLHAAAHASGQGDELSHDALKDFVTGEHFTMLDEDNMASNSNTQAATQQSIKAYADSVAGGAAFAVAAVLGTL